MTNHKTGALAPRQTSLGVAYGAGAGAMWGLVFLAPALVGEFAPLQLAVGRYLAFGVLAGCLVAPRWSVLSALLSRKDWLSLCWLALCGNTLYYVLLSAAVQAGGIALTSLIIGFLPVAVTVIGSKDHGAVPLRRLAPSLLCCMAGAVCIGWQALRQPSLTGQPWLGVVCALGALGLWTAYAVNNSRCLSRLHHVSAQDWNLLLGLVTGAQAVLLLPVALLGGSLQHSGGAWSAFVVVSCSVAVIASLFGNALWNRMSRLLPLTLVGQMILFETLFALLYGFLWERRWPHGMELAAFACVVGSVLLCVHAHKGHNT